MEFYLETFLEQLADKSNVIIQTDTDPTYGNNVLGNHWAARWRHVLATKFSVGAFRVKAITYVFNGGDWHWVVTLNRQRDWITDKLSSESNCTISGLDYKEA